MTKLRFWLWFLVVAVLAGGAAGIWWAGLLTTRYTATATLLVAPSEPHLLGGSAEKPDWTEFELFRNNQTGLIHEHYVIQAALRDSPKLKNLPSIQREDVKHNAVAWLTKQIRVETPNNTGILKVSATESDPQEAAAIVNAVVDAYMDQVVNGERAKRRERFESLQHIATEKEDEVRKMRQVLKSDLESLGVGDNQSLSVRGQMAMQIYVEHQRELQAMRRERTEMQGQLQVAMTMQKMLSENSSGNAVSDLEVSSLLFTIPVYRELHSRIMLHDLDKYHAARTTKPAPAESEGKQSDPDVAKPAKSEQKPSAKSEGKPAVGGPKDAPNAETQRSPTNERREMSKQELDTIGRILDDLKAQCRDMLLDAKRRELQQEINRLNARLDIATDQINAFEKVVAAKARDAEAVGRTTVDVQMLKADLENVERILREVSDERERLKVELESKPRVTVMAPATAPENPD